MRYAEHLPGPVLRPRVNRYWTLRVGPAGEGPRGAASVTTDATAESLSYLVLPDGCMDIIWSFGSPLERPGEPPLVGGRGVVVGVMTHARPAAAAPNADLLGVRFRPGEARALLECPPIDARDRSLLLQDLWGRAADLLSERLAGVRTDRERFQVLDRELSGRFEHARPIDLRVRRAIRILEEQGGGARVAALASEVGLGDRQLERAFLAQVGIGPKTLARVLRLQALAGRLLPGLSGPSTPHRPRGPSWTELSADLGFSDQAHLVREVRDLCGVTPTELARVRGVSDSFNRPSPGAATFAAE